MAHFAKVLNGKVINVIVAEQDYIDNMVDTSPGKWIQTSYNTRGGVHLLGGTPLRKNYATIGGNYDEIRDAFYLAQPHKSWTLNETTCFWEAPLTKPNGNYRWNEDAYQADNTKGWVEVTDD